MSRRVIRASEIGAYRYCKRNWWYRRQGVEPSNRAALERGVGFHHRHGRAVLTARLLRAAGWVLLLAALTMLTVAAVLWLWG